MKKGIWMSCFVLLTFTASAQRFEASVVAGINLSQIDGDRLAGFNQIGVSAGGKVAAVLSERWQFGLEILFSQQGANRINRDDPASIYDNIRLNFVEVPVLFHFKEWKFHLSGGASYARLINYKVTDFRGGDITDTQKFNENNISLVLGGTYYFREKTGVEIRWFRSLNDLQGNTGGGSLIGRSLSFKIIQIL